MQVDHELSVPAVKMMLLSCACFATVAAAQLLLADRVSSDAKLRLRAAAAATTLVFNYMVSVRHDSHLHMYARVAHTSSRLEVHAVTAASLFGAKFGMFCL